MSLALLLVFLGLVLPGAAHGLARLVDDVWERCLPTVVIASLAPVFLGGLLGQLALGRGVALVAIAGLAVWGLVDLVRRRLWRPAPSILLLLLLLLVGAKATRRMMFSIWDEFSHWGRVTALMVNLDTLSFGLPPEVLPFRYYPPGTALFPYLLSGIRPGPFVEGDAYLAAGYIMTALALPLLAGLGWRRWKLLAAFVVVLALAPHVFLDPFFEVYADAPMGALLGYAWYVLLRRDRRNTLLHVATPLALLPLVKPAGVGLAVFALLLAACLWAQRTRAKGTPWRDSLRSSWIPAVIALAATLLPRMLWKWTLALHHVVEGWSNPTLPGAIAKTVLHRGDPVRVATTSAFLRALGERAVTHQTWPLTVLSSAVLIALGIILLQRHVGEERAAAWRVTPWVMLVGLLSQLAGTWLVYLFQFSSYEALRLASFERYIGAFLTAALVALAWCAHDVAASRPDEASASRPLVAVLAGVMLFGPVGDTLTAVYGDRPAVATSVREVYQPGIAALQQCGVGTETPFWVLDQYSDGLSTWIYGTALAGHPVGGWSVGPAKDEKDIWTRDLTPEAWATELQGYGFLLVHHTEPIVTERYGRLFPGGGLEQGAVYRIAKTDTGVTLTRC